MKGVCWAITDSETTSPNLTTGKRYMNARWNGKDLGDEVENTSMHILNDLGHECFIILDGDVGCAYLVNGGKWQVIKPTEDGEVMYYP
jgi:hypothetical protein